MLRNLILSITALFLLTGCPDHGTIRENEMVNRWIYDQMGKHYLWASEMPPKEDIIFDTHPETFFNRLKYRVGSDIYLSDNYSEIHYIGEDEHYPLKEEDTEYGAESETYNFGMVVSIATSSDLQYSHILYVVAGSPAERAGLKRGDCFKSINDLPVKDMSKRELVNYLGSITTAKLDIIYPEEKTVTLRKQYYADNPVHFDTIYDFQPVTGYLLYNHFTNGNNNSYYSELQSVFARFKAAGVENIVVDLRYNGGGELDAARKMCSLLAPPASLGQTYLYKEYKSSYGNPEEFTSEILYTGSQMSPYNCGDISLYIITSQSTASASELVVHCLRPLYLNAGLKFVQVGNRTDGKNVGGQPFSHDRYEWILDIITLRVYNVDKVSGYEEGLVPDFSLKEFEQEDQVQTASGSHVTPIPEYGDASADRLLRVIMDDIYGYGGWPAYSPGEGLRPVVATARLGRDVKVDAAVKARPLRERRGTIPQ